MEYGILTFNEPKKDASRKIIHIDMDAFYAAVEIRENPQLKGKPVIIARHPKDTGGRGVVTTASYEARKYGVHSAMPAQKAYELCPEGIFIPGRHDLYRQVSSQIHEIFQRYTDLIEAVSLDEAYLDVTQNKLNFPSATLIAKRIQREIYQELQLTCSAGVSYNKFIAKLASDYQKPRGLTLVQPEDAENFLAGLPIEDFHGVGKKTLERMEEMGIETGADLKAVSYDELLTEFGKMGTSLYKRVRGIDNSPVRPFRDPKSIGKEHTFHYMIQTENQVRQELRDLAQKVEKALARKEKHGKTLVLKVRNEDYETFTKRKTFPHYLEKAEDLFQVALEIFYEHFDLSKPLRLLGITVTNLDDKLYENIELPLWKNKGGHENEA